MKLLFFLNLDDWVDEDIKKRYKFKHTHTHENFEIPIWLLYAYYKVVIIVTG